MSTIPNSSDPMAALFGLTRRAVLALLFGNPENSYYLREIARIAGSGLGAVQREINHLCEAGIICRTVRGRQVYFQANKSNPVFPELKGLVTKTSDLTDVIQSALRPLAEKIRVAFIFGSFARLEQRPNSDVDILVVGEVDFEEVVTALAPAQRVLDREMNPAVYPAAEFRSKLHAKHHFLTSVMKGPKIFLIGDDFELARLGQQRLAH